MLWKEQCHWEVSAYLNMNIFILLFVKSLEHLWGVCELHADCRFFVTFLFHVHITGTSTAKHYNIVRRWQAVGCMTQIHFLAWAGRSVVATLFGLDLEAVQPPIQRVWMVLSLWLEKLEHEAGHSSVSFWA